MDVGSKPFACLDGGCLQGKDNDVRSIGDHSGRLDGDEKKGEVEWTVKAVPKDVT